MTSVAWSPDGKLVASGSWDKTIRIWDVATGKEAMGPLKKMLWMLKRRLIKKVHKVSEHHPCLCTLKGHSDLVRSVAWSPDGKLVASGSDDKSIRIWDVATGKEAMGPLTGHSREVTSVAWSPCGKFVASGSWDNTIKIWHAETGSEKCSLKGSIASWQNLEPHTKELAAKVKQGGAPNRTGQYIVTADDNNNNMVYVYLTNADGEERDGEEPLACFRSPASVACVSCMGTSVVVGCQDGQVSLRGCKCRCIVSVLFAQQIMLSAEVPLLPRGTTSASALGVAFDYFIVEAFCPVPDLLRP